MKLKEKIAILGIVGLSNALIVGASIQNNEMMVKQVNDLTMRLEKSELENQDSKEVIEIIEGVLSSMGEELTLINHRITDLKQQPTNDNISRTRIEENVELKPSDVGNKPQASPSQSKSVNVRISFYTDLAKENGGYAGMNAIGGKLKLGSVSAPKSIPFGSTISIPEMGNLIGCNTFTVDDRGGGIYIEKDGTYRLDVFVPQRQGESDSAYFNRVNNMGIVRTKATINSK